MVLTFRSTIYETFKIIGEDSDGSRRVAVATKDPANSRQWNLQLTHPSGRAWTGTFHGPNILDGLAELLNSKETDYIQAKGRGHRPEQAPFDYNRRISDDAAVAPIIPRWSK
jgi:hypothetical protein